MSTRSTPAHRSQPPTPLATRHELLQHFEQWLIATLGALLVGVIYFALGESLTVGPNWLVFVLEVLLLVPPLFWVLVMRRPISERVLRTLNIGLLVVLTLALASSLALLVQELPHLSKGYTILRSAGLLWLSNILIFATWYWEIDGGGPHQRHRAGHIAADFQFPQQVGGKPMRWAPGFVDYVFLAFCSATALSPADTMPLTQRAKLLMMVQALISLLILVLLVARSVNILT